MSLQITTRAGDPVMIDDEALTAFDTAVRGEIVTAESADYDEVRAVWNRMIDRHPALIVRCTGTADVVTAVNFARENDLLLAVRGGGHNAAGSATCQGGMMIDLSLMKGVFVDAPGRTVRVQGGATLGDVDHETQLYGLATPLGVVSETGVAGLTLGGGYGHLRRMHGLSCDNILSVEIVTADGQVRTASAEENSDLFWAIRGGGGNFGVVTSFEFQLYPVGPTVYYIGVMYPQETVGDVLPAWLDFMDQAPREFSCNCLYWTIPDVDAFPPEARNVDIVAISGVHIGPLDEAAEALQPLRELGEPVLDLSGEYPFTAVQAIFDWVFPKNQLYNYWKSLYGDPISDEAADVIYEWVQQRPTNTIMFDIWAMGGAITDVAAEDSAMGDRSAPVTYVFNTSWVDPELTDDCLTWTRDFYEALLPYSPGGSYLNFPGFMGEEEGLVHRAYGRNYERLAHVKAAYDPQNLFSVNMNVQPA
jgi:FAD/FMN-containing dehydrogenase